MNRIFRIQNPALRLWISYGAILGFIEIAFGFLSQIIGLDVVTYSLLTLGVYLVLSLLAARRDSSRTGRLSSGVLAGLLVGLIGALLYSIVELILTFSSVDSIRQYYQNLANQQHLHVTYTNADVMNAELQNALTLLVIVAVVGSLGGVVGAFLGRRRMQPPQQEYEDPMVVEAAESPRESPAE